MAKRAEERRDLLLALALAARKKRKAAEAHSGGETGKPSRVEREGG